MIEMNSDRWLAIGLCILGGLVGFAIAAYWGRDARKLRSKSDRAIDALRAFLDATQRYLVTSKGWSAVAQHKLIDDQHEYGNQVRAAVENILK